MLPWVGNKGNTICQGASISLAVRWPLEGGAYAHKNIFLFFSRFLPPHKKYVKEGHLGFSFIFGLFPPSLSLIS